MSRILLVEDESAIAETVVYALQADGHQLEHRLTARDALVAAAGIGFDLAILDVGLPDLNGFALCAQLRAQRPLPVIFLTARDAESERVLGFELGADDYVPKPCTPRELTARLRAILRRTVIDSPDHSPYSPLAVGALSMWPEQRRATWSGRPLELTSSEFNLLEVLARNAGKPVSKQHLSEQGLGRPLARFDRNIDVHLSSIRQKIATLGSDKSCIQTVYRLGYQFIKE